MDFVIPKITVLGDGGAVWILTAIILCLNKRNRKTGVTILIGLAAGYFLGNIILKPLIGRFRPIWIKNDVDLLIKMPMDYSFPSGHTLSSFIAAFILWRCGSRLRFVAFALAGAIGFSRLYLYVHFPTDVIGGILLGALIAFVVTRLSKYIFKQKGLPL